MTKSRGPLFQNNDPKELRTMITVLQERGYDVLRPQAYHLKIGPINFFPTTGKITLDPHTSHPRKGFRELLSVLEKAKQSAHLEPHDNLPEIAPPLTSK